MVKSEINCRIGTPIVLNVISMVHYRNNENRIRVKVTQIREIDEPIPQKQLTI